MFSKSAIGTVRPGRLTSQLFTNSAIYGLSRLLGLFSMLALSPAVAATYGVTGLGAYTSVMSLITFLAAVDSAIGGSVRTAVAEAAANGRGLDLYAAARKASEAARTWILATMAAVILIGIVVPWEEALSSAEGEFPPVIARTIVVVFGTMYLLGVYRQVNTRVLEGAQLNAVAASTGLVPPFFTMAIVLAGCAFGAPLAFVIVLPALAPFVQGSAARLYIRRRSDLTHTGVESGRWHALNPIALPMMVISLAYAASYSLDYWVVGWLLGPSETGIYSAAARPAQLMLVVAAAVGPVLWTHFATARADGNVEVLRSKYVWRMVFAFTLVGGTTGVAYSAGTLSLGELLTAGQGKPASTLIWAFGLWGALMVAHQPLAMLLNNGRGLRLQMVSMGLMTSLNVGLSLYLVPRVGSAGAVLASIVALVSIHIPMLVFGAQRHLRGAT